MSEEEIGRGILPDAVQEAREVLGYERETKIECKIVTYTLPTVIYIVKELRSMHLANEKKKENSFACITYSAVQQPLYQFPLSIDSKEMESLKRVIGVKA